MWNSNNIFIFCQLFPPLFLNKQHQTNIFDNFYHLLAIESWICHQVFVVAPNIVFTEEFITDIFCSKLCSSENDFLLNNKGLGVLEILKESNN